MTLVGIGYDVHRLVAGRKLVLGGVEISHTMGLEGHSDADVLIHAIADALLGAVGDKDIGHHFPNTDESIRGISSLEILARVGQILRDKHAFIQNIDSTLIAEAPKIGPHINEMRTRLAGALKMPIGRIGIKATTNERLGFLGRAEGMAAMAVASVEVEPDLEMTQQQVIV
jgi:2-C-methyl-D-erythritol 2,4-cyclodiphosphate synthase